MFYYTYIIRLSESDKYYVGRHQSKRNPSDDPHSGSGRWVRSIKDRSRLRREIIEFYSCEEDLKVAEEELLALHYGKPNCMNMNERPVGFSSSDNPSKSVERRELNRKRLLENNPMKGRKHSPETLEKMRLASTGRAHTDESKGKMSQTMLGKNVGKRRSDEQRVALSERRREEYRTGTRIHARGMKGKQHSDDAKLKMKAAQQIREKKQCCNCGGFFAVCAFNRWHGDNCKAK